MHSSKTFSIGEKESMYRVWLSRISKTDCSLSLRLVRCIRWAQPWSASMANRWSMIKTSTSCLRCRSSNQLKSSRAAFSSTLKKIARGERQKVVDTQSERNSLSASINAAANLITQSSAIMPSRRTRARSRSIRSNLSSIKTKLVIIIIRSRHSPAMICLCQCLSRRTTQMTVVLRKTKKFKGSGKQTKTRSSDREDLKKTQMSLV